MKNLPAALIQLTLCLIIGSVWLDTNHNSIFDSSDRFVSDVSIGLVDNTGMIITVEETNADGQFSFDLTGGSYRLRAWAIRDYCYFPDTGNVWGDTYWVDIPPLHEYSLRMVCFGDPILPNRMIFPIFLSN